MTAQQAVTHFTPVLAIRDGKPATTSLNIAQVFGKRHDDTLKAIRALGVPEEFSLRNFAESTYLDRGKEQPQYIITRDGFTILAMGFTGAKAMQFKLAYIEAFNRMEAQLASIAAAPALPPAAGANLEAARLEGAKSGYILRQRMQSTGKNTRWIRRIIKYRVMGLSERETAAIMGCNRHMVGEWEKIVRGAGLWDELAIGSVERFVKGKRLRKQPLSLCKGGAA